jgi:hypothetical protein
VHTGQAYARLADLLTSLAIHRGLRGCLLELANQSGDVGITVSVLQLLHQAHALALVSAI